MAWTAPRTWVTAETVTAAHMNAHIRDNLLESSAATATTAGDIVYADAANSMGSRLGIGAAHGLLASTGAAPVWRIPGIDTDTASKTFTETSYTSLANFAATPFSGEVEVTVTTGTLALVLHGSAMANTTAGASTLLSFSVSGATTTAASDNWAYAYDSSVASDVLTAATFYMPTLTAGSNTFTLEARVSAGTGSLQNPRIAVIPL